MIRKILLIAGSVVVFAVINGLIIHKESILSSGKTVLLKLAPRDPRSLMQGDYMVLRYAIARGPARNAIESGKKTGAMVIKLDQNQVGQFARLHDDEKLSSGEVLLQYKHRGEIRLGAESFFFQEGHAQIYESAQYGELKVASSGKSVLGGLRDDKFKPLGPKNH